MSPTLHIGADLAALAGPVLHDAISARIADTGRCRIGLSGGSTPGPTLAWLGRHLTADVHHKLWITWVDERNVPRDSPESSYRLAWDAWLAHAPIPAGQILPMADGGPLDAEVARFAARFAADFDGGLDIAQLGVGPDGHIASLFPGSPALDATAPVLAVRDSPKPPPERITLSLPVLAATPVVVLLARGANKANILARALASDPTLPLGRLTPSGSVHWVIDPAAASHL